MTIYHTIYGIVSAKTRARQQAIAKRSHIKATKRFMRTASAI